MLRRRPSKANLRTSVIVPCVNAHANLLPELLAYVIAQSVRPDEVVISISGAVTAPPHVRAYAEGCPFPVRILASALRANAARNRNRASDASTGDVLIYQDADDLPHPQRVEIIKHVFETYELHHVMHHFTKSEGAQSPKWSHYALPAAVHTDPSFVFYYDVTNGNVATSRALHRAVHWPENVSVGEDVHFNKAAYERFPGATGVLKLPLLFYRQHLSGTRY